MTKRDIVKKLVCEWELGSKKINFERTKLLKWKNLKLSKKNKIKIPKRKMVILKKKKNKIQKKIRMSNLKLFLSGRSASKCMEIRKICSKYSISRIRALRNL